MFFSFLMYSISAGALLPDDNEDHGAAIYSSNEFEGDIAGVSQDGLERVK